MDALDKVETLLAHLICADAANASNEAFTWSGTLGHQVRDAGDALRFAQMFPTDSYTADAIDGGRIFTTNPRLLLVPPQETIGACSEIVLLCQDHVKWMGFRALRKLPRNVWVAKRGASLYESHYRVIFPNGRSTYSMSVAAVDASGNPLPCVIVGSRGDDNLRKGTSLVLAASLIEDAHRQNALLARISEVGAVRIPIPIGEHRDLFALRDAPLTKEGRRRAILHWVAKHTRAARDRRVDVAPHWRGTRTLSIDGLKVELTPNYAGVSRDRGATASTARS